MVKSPHILTPFVTPASALCTHMSLHETCRFFFLLLPSCVCCRASCEADGRDVSQRWRRLQPERRAGWRPGRGLQKAEGSLARHPEPGPEAPADRRGGCDPVWCVPVCFLDRTPLSALMRNRETPPPPVVQQPQQKLHTSLNWENSSRPHHTCVCFRSIRNFFF